MAEALGNLTSEEHCLWPSACVLQHEAGCVCVCVCVHHSQLVPHSPPHLSQSSVWKWEAGRQCLQLARSGATPKPLCFPSPPLCRPSSLFLFLFCCRFNSSSWTLSVLPERYLVSVWHPSPSFSCPCIFPPAGQSRTLSCSSGQRLVTVCTAPYSPKPWLPSALCIVTSAL